MIIEELIVWEAERDTPDDTIGRLICSKGVICTCPFWQAVAIARFHNEALGAIVATIGAIGHYWRPRIPPKMFDELYSALGQDTDTAK